MAWVKLPCVCDATSLSGWHEELQALIVLGGRANKECISSVRYPAGADGGVVIDEAFSTNRCNWCFVEVIRTIDLLAGKFSGVTALEAQKVESELDLVQELVLQL
jgi:hypothetical protein